MCAPEKLGASQRFWVSERAQSASGAQFVQAWRVMHSRSDNIEIMLNDRADEVTKELFKSLKNRYQNNWNSMKGSEFVFEYVHYLSMLS